MAPITSFIRWAGGKSWLVPYVAQLTEGLDYNNYYEPFMGGASIFFSLNLPNKLCDRSPEEIMAIERKQQEAVKPRLKVDETKAAFTLQEAAVLLDLTYNEVRRLIQTGEIDARKYGTRYLIPRDDIKWFLFQQKLDREN